MDDMASLMRNSILCAIGTVWEIFIAIFSLKGTTDICLMKITWNLNTQAVWLMSAHDPTMKDAHQSLN